MSNINTGNLKVHLRYSWLFDSACSSEKPFKPTERVKKLHEVLPKLQAEWDQNGTKLCQAVTDLTGKNFIYKELIATLFTNEDFTNMSLPLLMNCNFLLDNYTEKNQSLFISLLFHEILHYFTVDYDLVFKSPFIKTLGNLHRRTANHLHLFAIEKKVYEYLNKKNEFVIIQEAENAEGPNYQKAWNIVNEPSSFDLLWQEICS